MKSLKLLSLLVFSFLFFLPISCYTISNYEIRDLESTTSYFQQESLTWTSSNKISLQNTTQCSGNWLLGGYGITSTNTLFQRSYTGLAPHTALYFSFTFWVLDLSYFTINLGNFLKISSDSLALQYWGSSFLRTLLSSSICGGSNPDYPSITITGKLVHSQPVFNLQIQSLVASSYATFGFRNISILLLNTSAPISSSACVFNQPNLGQTSCLCPQGTFDSLLGLFCVPCDPACETCFGPSASKCASCNEGFYWNGHECVLCDSSCLRCKGPGRNDCLRCRNDDFLFWNGTCQGACEASLKRGIREDVEICKKPCEDDEFLYWNGSCLESCEAPLVREIDGNGMKNCSLPCDEEDWFWGLNGTCQEICKFPLVEIEQGDLKTCDSPCQKNLGEFLYWNGSCLENCPVSFQENLGGDQVLCKEHCPLENFTYWNQSCLGDCHPPFVIFTDDEGLNYCELPCNISTEGAFLYQNNSCLGACLSPFVKEPLVEGISLCKFSCGPAEYYSLDDFTCVNTCDSPRIFEQIGLLRTCQTPQERNPAPDNNTTTEVPPTSSALETLGQVTSSVAAVVGLLNFNDPTSIFVLILSDLLRYIKYIEVSYPQKVEDLFNTEDQLFSITFAMGYNITEKFKSDLPEHRIPEIFQKRNLHSSFLINNWDQLTFLLISLMAIAIYYPFSWLINRTGVRFIIKGTKRIKSLLKWNLFLMLFFTNYAEITLYSGLELLTFSPSSVPAVFSLTTCLVLILLGIYFLYKTLRISLELIHSGRKISPLSDPEEQTVRISRKNDGYKILHEAYKNSSIFTQGYLFFFTLRIVLCYALVLILHEYPIPQSIILTTLSLFSFIYALVARPMKETFGLVETLVFEMIVLIVNICVILLAILDNNGQEAMEQRERIGAVIILCNTIMRILSTVFVVTSLFLSLREIYLAKKNKIPGNKLSLRRVLSLLFFHGSVRTTAPQAPRPVPMTFRAKEKPIENKEEQEIKRESGKKNHRKVYMVTNIDTFENDKILSTDPHLTNEGLSVTQTRSFIEQKSLLIHHRPSQILHYENPISHQTFQEDSSEASPPISPLKYPRYSIESLNESQSPPKMMPRRSRGSLVETFFPDFEKRDSVGSNSEEQVGSLIEVIPQLKSLQSTNRRESRKSIKILIEPEEQEVQVVEIKSPVKISNMRDKSLLKLSLRNIKRRSRRLETIHEHEKKGDIEEVRDEIGSKSTGNPDFAMDSSEISLRRNVKENYIPTTREFLEVPSQSQGDFSGRGSPVPSDCSSGEGSGSECGEKMEVGGNGQEKSRRSIFGRVGAGGQRRNSNMSNAKEEVEEVFQIKE